MDASIDFRFEPLPAGRWMYSTEHGENRLACVCRHAFCYKNQLYRLGRMLRIRGGQREQRRLMPLTGPADGTSLANMMCFMCSLLIKI